MMLMAETRPSSRGGVTDCRSVVVDITHRIGPAPGREKAGAASRGLGTTLVSATTTAAAKPVPGPSATTGANRRGAITRVAESAPTAMPTPYIARVVPTPDADNPRCL